MASGHGAFGGVSQCYRFWLGFSQCRLQTTNPNLCLLEQADYKECIHRGRLKRRIAAKALEIAKQGQAQKDGSNAPAASVPKE